MPKHTHLLGWGLITAWGLVSLALDFAPFPGGRPLLNAAPAFISALACLCLLAWAHRPGGARGQMGQGRKTGRRGRAAIWAAGLVTSACSAVNQAALWVQAPPLVPVLAQTVASFAYIALMYQWFCAYAPHDPQVVESSAIWSTMLCAIIYLAATLVPYEAAFALWLALPLLSSACLVWKRAEHARTSGEANGTASTGGECPSLAQTLTRQGAGGAEEPAGSAGAAPGRPLRGSLLNLLSIAACSLALSLPANVGVAPGDGTQATLVELGGPGGLALAAALVLWYVTSARRIDLRSLFKILSPLAAVGLLLAAVPNRVTGIVGLALTTAGCWALYVFVWIYAVEQPRERPDDLVRHFAQTRMAFEAGGTLAGALMAALGLACTPDVVATLVPYVLFGGLAVLTIANALLPGIEEPSDTHDGMAAAGTGMTATATGNMACPPDSPGAPGGAGRDGAGSRDAGRDVEQALDALISHRAGRLAAQFGLSERESQILTRLLRGYSTAAIRNELAIAKGTIDTYIQRIYRKCGVHARQELVELAEGRAPSLPGNAPNSTTTTGNAGRDASGEASRQ